MMQTQSAARERTIDAALVTRVDDGRSSAVEGMPLLPLTLAGTALVAVTLAVTATMSEKHQGAYEPAVVIDGKVQPGRIK